MITLYDLGNSVCCQKVRVTLCEKGLDWESVNVDLFRAEQYDPKYLKLNRKGLPGADNCPRWRAGDRADSNL
jgi:glutathione S-transferase